MYFASGVFILFFVVLFTVYWLTPHRFRAYLLVSGSYLFYAYWSIPFMLLLIYSTLLDYFVPILMRRYPAKKKVFLLISLVGNFSVLGFFKYFNFFIEQFNFVISQFFTSQLSTLEIILPLGISFYTFQTVSHSIDAYRGELKRDSSLLYFANYVAFFPQLIAGPIERSKHLLPQFSREKKFQDIKFEEAFWDIGLGFLKKLFIADNLLELAQWGFFNFGLNSFVGFWVGSIAGTLWIYTDFSSYSDIAIGLGKLLGFNLSTNFKRPFFSTNPSDFWQHWHRTLGTWFRDYVYSPLIKSRKKSVLWQSTVLLITMTLIGFWHGAQWTYILFGLSHGMAILCWRYFPGPKWPKPLSMIAVFLFFNVTGGMFFISQDLANSWEFFKHYTSLEPFISARDLKDLGGVLFFVLPLFIIEFVQHKTRQEYIWLTLPWYGKMFLYGVFMTLIISKGSFGEKSFYYFQF